MTFQPESLSSVLEKAMKSMKDEYTISMPKIQTVPAYLQEEDKYAKYYRPKLISIGPIHHKDPKLKRGEQYKLMWAAMFTIQNGKDPESLYKRVLSEIKDLRELFLWDESENCYSDEELSTMLFVDGCSVLQILEKGNLSSPEDLNVKVDQLVLVQRDLLLLENQLPYKVISLLVDDEATLKVAMRGFCELQNMFTVLLVSPQSPFFRDPKNQIEKIKGSPPPIHLLDCLRTTILNVDNNTADLQVQRETQNDESVRNNRANAEAIGNYYISVAESGVEKVRAINLLTIAYAYAHRNKNERTTYRTIQELKAATIGMKRQKNVSLRTITFSSSFIGGQLHLPPLILDDSTVPTLLNLVAYEMCPDFINSFEISSYVKLLDLLIDHQKDVKELREAGILQNSLGSDEEVSDLFNAISSGLVHNPSLYSGIRKEMEKHYKNRFSIWFADARYTHFKSPWTIIGFLAATLLLILTFIQSKNSFPST